MIISVETCTAVILAAPIIRLNQRLRDIKV
jgi:hypothetical protein